MTNRYCNLIGTNKIKDEYTKINDGFTSMQAHIDGTADKHAAAKITFDPTGMTKLTGDDVQEVLGQVENEINAFIGVNVNAEVGSAHNSSVKGTVFADIDARFEEIEQDHVDHLSVASDYCLYPQSPKPPKTGIHTCTPKVIYKTTADELQIIQKVNKGYAHYTFAKNSGASGDDDYGVNHELIRLIRARQIQDAYVYYDISTPATGSLTVNNAPGQCNTIESLLFHLPQYENTRNLSSKADNVGMGTYTLAASSEVTYNIPVSKAKKANILLMGTAASAEDVQISINDKLVKSFNAQAGAIATPSGNGAAVVEFEIPCKSTTQDTFTLKIRNNSVSGNTYICALNFFELKDYTNQVISDFKCFGSSKNGWIESSGASDYALYDKTVEKWFGSYHGGEISEYDRLTWNATQLVEENDYYTSHVQFSTISVGDWRAQRHFEIYQQTSLASAQAKMVSKFNFNIDGTIEMDFGYYDGAVDLATFYTALTCTYVGFNYLFYPKFYYFGSTPTNTYYDFLTTEGKVSQVNSTDVLQLDIRFTKFNNKHDTRGATIADNDAYRKFYYGPIYGAGANPVQLSALSFSKGLDFIVR